MELKHLLHFLVCMKFSVFDLYSLLSSYLVKINKPNNGQDFMQYLNALIAKTIAITSCW